MDITVGTAGHIDHGKTTLIKALTGVDTDRLPEEKQRGITIDLGFAELELDGVHIGFVDVPGHERFVKNMLAGASGIDLVMLIIAADEGVMPQTREHFEICRLLNVSSGIVVLTKIDLVDEETLDLARLETAELAKGSFLENAPVIAVNSRNGSGIEELKAALRTASSNIKPRRSDLVTRLPIDRSFTVKGFGAVVTGTLVSGEIGEGDELELMPSGRKVRIRGVQVHRRKTTTAVSGQRAALNLAGIDHHELSRGMELCGPGTMRPTQVIDAEIEVLSTATRGIRSRQRVRAHIGTAEVLARVSVLNAVNEIPPGETGLVQLRLEVPIVCVPDERFIIRQYSPQVTIAGGRILDGHADKHKKKDLDKVIARLHEIADDASLSVRVRILVESAGAAGINSTELQVRTGAIKPALAAAIRVNVSEGSAIVVGEHIIASAEFGRLSVEILTAIGTYHKLQPLAKGMPLPLLREAVFAYAVEAVEQAVIAHLSGKGELVILGDAVRLKGHRTELDPSELKAQETIRNTYKTAGLDVPKVDELMATVAAESNLRSDHVRKLFQTLIDGGEIVKISDDFYFHEGILNKLVGKLRTHASGVGESLIDVAQFKEMAGISRKYAIPLLEYFDRTRVTVRAGDKRKIIL